MKYLFCSLVFFTAVAVGFTKPVTKAGKNRYYLLHSPKIFFNKTVGDTIDPSDPKVIIGKDSSRLEITPASSFNNGLLIRPVNNAAGTGVPTAFYSGDTSSWSFYTGGKQRFSINGPGNVSSSVPLLINFNGNDKNSALRVNGQARVDSIFYLQAAEDSLSFISFNRKVKSVYTDPDDKISPYTSTPTAWALSFGSSLPVFRIRHPNNVSSGVGNTSILRDFMILPYQYGFAIEFNGVVECWVGEWSFHRNDFYKDTEGKNNGYGAVMWVGNDQDIGGLRFTARDNSHKGGNVAYGEISVERYGTTPNGDLRLRLPSNQNQFHFIYGERGSNNIIAKISDKGIFIPKGSSAGSIPAPEKGQIYFDSTSAEFKGYDGSDWVSLTNKLITGSTILSANGTSTFYQIPHGLGATPSYFNVIATSNEAGSIKYVTADATNISVYYSTAPAAGTDNLSWNWEIKK